MVSQEAAHCQLRGCWCSLGGQLIKRGQIGDMFGWQVVQMDWRWG